MTTPLTPAQARDRLLAFRRQLADLEVRIPAAVSAVHRELTVLDGFGARGESSGRGSGVPDPTGATAVQVIDHGFEELEDVVQWFDTLNCTLGLMASWVGRRAPANIEHARCSGGRTVEAWSRPECTNWVDYYRTSDGEVRSRGDGLCTACRKRRDRWQAAQADVVEAS